MTDLALFAASFLYFWVVMFDRHPRYCAILGGAILIGSSGVLMRPENEEFYRSLTAMSVAALLVGRAWLIWSQHK